MKLLTGFLAFLSSLFIRESPPAEFLPPPPLNAAVIAYSETYFSPAVTEPGNFPWANKIKEEPASTLAPAPPAPPLAPAPIPTPIAITPLPSTPPPPVLTPPDQYLAIPEPITSWLTVNLSFRGTSFDESPRILPELTFDREYWRMEVFAYWASDKTPPKPPVETDYFKIEVYEKGSDKLVYTMVSGRDDSIHKFQAFKKSGAYYFKVYTKEPSQWDINFTVSPTLAK